VTLEDIDECVLQFLPKLFYTIEEDKNRIVIIYVPDQVIKSVFHELSCRMAIAIPFRVLPMSIKGE
jgi:hypothetical protein